MEDGNNLRSLGHPRSAAARKILLRNSRDAACAARQGHNQKGTPNKPQRLAMDAEKTDELETLRAWRLGGLKRASSAPALQC